MRKFSRCDNSPCESLGQDSDFFEVYGPDGKEYRICEGCHDAIHREQGGILIEPVNGDEPFYIDPEAEDDED